jgi:lambda family phage minor tail protein L
MLKHLNDESLDVIELYEISQYNLDDLNETVRLTNSPESVFYRVAPNLQPQEYFPFGIEGDGYELSGQGSLPQPTITVTNISSFVSSWLRDVRHNPRFRIEGAMVVRRVTLLSYLEGGPDAMDTLRERSPDIFRIIQIADRNEQLVRFLLSTPIDLENVKFGLIALKTCSFDYRDQLTCNYQGGAMFTRDNEVTEDPLLDLCNGSLEACSLRFPERARTSGIPGLGGS